MGEIVGVLGRNRVELPRWNGGGSDPLSGRNAGPAELGYSALGHRVLLCAADCSDAAGAVAAMVKTGSASRRWAQLFRVIFHPLQSCGQLHDGGAGQSGAVDIAASDDAGRRSARRRTIDTTQIRRGRHCGHWCHRRAGVGAGRRAAGSLAGRVDHGGRGFVHGVLQRLVPPVHSAIQRDGLS